MYLTREGQLQVTSGIVQLSDRLLMVTVMTIGDLDAALVRQPATMLGRRAGRRKVERPLMPLSGPARCCRCVVDGGIPVRRVVPQTALRGVSCGDQLPGPLWGRGAGLK